MLKPNKLLEKISPKQLVGIILQHEVEDICDQATAFSYEDIRIAIDALDKEQLPAYRGYLELADIVKGLQYEARIAGLHALWRLSLCILRRKKSLEKEVEMLLEYRNSIISHLKKFYIIQAALKIIDDLMGCNVQAFIQYESEKLNDLLELYESSIGLLEDDLAFAAFERGEEIDNVEFFPQLDIASLQPTPETLDKMKAYFQNPKGDSAWVIVDFMKQNC